MAGPPSFRIVNSAGTGCHGPALRLTPEGRFSFVRAVPRLIPTAVGMVALSLLVPAGAMASVPSTDRTAPPVSPDGAEAFTAQILMPVAARRAPRADAGVVSRLMPYTAYSRRNQVLLVTGEAEDGAGRDWVRVHLPTRPNGTHGWLPRETVVMKATRTRIRVLLQSRRVELWRSGRKARSFRAAVGTGHTPTPVGSFAIQDPVPAGATQRSYLGPWILTLTAHSTVLRSFMGGDGLVAIHGTNAPGLLGQAVSHGCIRLSNADVSALRRYAQPGVPVDILPR